MSLDKRTTNTNTKQRNLVTFSYPESLISEQYRTIRTNIKFTAVNKVMKKILITSPGMNEGKSTTAANLAVSMAQQKDKVLLIDANLRNPSIHQIFKITNPNGLTDILLNENISLEETVFKTGIGSLDVLASGTMISNASELIGSKIMKNFLKTVEQSYDVILIDSPSVREVTDTKIIADYCDGIILVYSNGKTELKHALETTRILKFAEDKILGVILNDNSRSFLQRLFNIKM
ncbi:CpsD/CapB family tyrosine-protein kinase [Bacillus sp. JJ634]